MAYCQHCGGALPEGTAFCTNCGAPVPSASAEEKRPAPPMRPDPDDFRPVPDQRPPRRSRFSVMGVGAYLGMFLLLCVPVVNLLFLLVWACGGARNQNRRNFARGFLLFTVILVALAFFISYLCNFDLVGYLTGLISSTTITIV